MERSESYLGKILLTAKNPKEHPMEEGVEGGYFIGVWCYLSFRPELNPSLFLGAEQEAYNCSPC